MLDEIAKHLGAMVTETWASDVQTWGKQVARYRRYADGDHDAKLSKEMMAMLRIQAGESQFNDNYCDLVVQAMAERLSVTGVEGDDPAATEWATDVMQDNRFDTLQMDVHESAIRDGDTFVMVTYDNQAGGVRLVHEPAYDGVVGMIPVYDRTKSRLVAAVKIWQEPTAASADNKRANIYFEDRIERYDVGQALRAIETVPWVDQAGQALGVPVTHFKHQSKSRQERGISALKGTIPLQDALNRTLVSMVMMSELGAFQIRIARGFSPPANLSPGMWVIIGEDGLTTDQVADASTLPQGEIAPYIAQAEFLVRQIGVTTQTPLPEFMGGDNQSGEALKQRETGLVGKVETFQTRGGNVWEDTFMLGVRIQQAFGVVQPPAVERFYCRWKPAQVRNEAQTIANAVAVRDAVGEREFLRLIAGVFGYDEAKIDTIMQEKAAEASARLLALAGNLPGFGQFGAG